MKHIPREALSDIPADLVCVSDYAKLAEQFIAPDIYAYILGGGGDEITLRRNRQALDRRLIVPRVLRDHSAGTTAQSLLGQSFRSPIVLAPVAFQQLVHAGGERETAQASSVLETAMVVSTLASQTLESIATELSHGKWFQLYLQQNRDYSLKLLRRAEAAGYTALMVTVDAPIHGIRNRAQRAGFELPGGVEAVNLKDRPELPNKILDPSQSIVFQGMMSEAPLWSDIEWLIGESKIPVILKGILAPEDALRAKAMGVAGVVVSNHGGRGLDCLPSAFEMLPRIRAAVGEGYPLLLDGGIERGTDVFKALALGADLVLVGRPQIYALAVAGGLGVAHMLRILREELEVSMALAGTPTVDDIASHCLMSGDF